MTAASVESHFFADDGTFPNSRLPLLVYRSVARGYDPDALETVLKRNGWPPQWQDTVFTFHHYHSRSHECLAVATGHATLRFGGPDGKELRVDAGDVIVIPAGVAHQRVVASTDFMVIGAYPPGQENFDALRGNPGDRPKADENIAKLATPETDPVQGPNGSLIGAWAG
jgi:uncharacterized protein YjlB